MERFNQYEKKVVVVFSIGSGLLVLHFFSFFWGFPVPLESGLSTSIDYVLLLVEIPLMILGNYYVYKVFKNKEPIRKLYRYLFPILGAVGFIISLFPLLFILLFALGGGGWGRPLRIRGRLLHPELQPGEGWTKGELPSREGLDTATCKALEALWLHDAQKEHASVPAFSRLSWQLIGVGAPPDLVAAVHSAALEEIDHAQKCFALARGYGAQSTTVLPMPELLVAPLGIKGNVFLHLAEESFKDGCLLEDYNADLAKACVFACAEPVTKKVLQQIAIEERSHAELSWRILEFCLNNEPKIVTDFLLKTAGHLDKIKRPTAVSTRNKTLVEKAQADLLRRHGRLPDSEWNKIWEMRCALTRDRLMTLMARSNQSKNGRVEGPTL